MKCNHCKATMINGVFCHEHGCPNEHKRWTDGEWVQVYTCVECGQEYTDVDEFSRCCAEEEDKKRPADVRFYLSDARGICIPRDFAQGTLRECISGVSQEDLDLLARGIDEEAYWDTWLEVLDHARVTAKDTGKSYFLHQDGNLWLVETGAEWDEENDQWVISE